MLKWPMFPLLIGSGVFAVASFFAIPSKPRTCDYCGSDYKGKEKVRIYAIYTRYKWHVLNIGKTYWFCNKEHLKSWLEKNE